jgi:membrane protein implicated in regulation of membrane protease activity
MIWWYWILLGLALAAVELVTPGGFFFAFFAVAALLVGGLEWIGLLTSDAVQWGLFSVLSVVCLAFFRKPLLDWIGRREPATDVDSLVGELATPVAPVAPGEYGRAELRGAVWSVRNIDSAAIDRNERCRVVAVRGLELDIRSERSR